MQALHITLKHTPLLLRRTSSPRCEKSFNSPLQMPHAFTVLVRRFPLPITLACNSKAVVLGVYNANIGSCTVEMVVAAASFPEHK
jgi:hypothetical protein